MLAALALTALLGGVQLAVSMGRGDIDPTAGSSTFVLLQMLRPDRRFSYGPGSRGGLVVHGLRWSPPRGVQVTLLSPPGQF